MSFSFIHQLLDNGISEEEILASLTKHVPNLARKASRMFSGGWSPRQVLDSFSQDRDVQKRVRKGLKPVTPSEIAAMRLMNSYDSIPQSQGKESREALMDLTKKAAPVAAVGLASQMAAPMAEAAMGRALPHVSNLLKKVGGLQTTDEGTLLPNPVNSTQIPTTNSIPTASQPPVNAPSIPQVSNPVQPEGISTKPRELSGIANMLAPGDEKSFEEAEKLAAKLTKGSTVISPQGVGEVKEIRNGKAIVEIDGKRHQVNEEDLESSPIPEKDMGILLDDLNKQIEKETGEQVSRAVNLVGFSPENRSVVIHFHNGDTYTYDDLSDEEMQMAQDIQGMRRTSGNNYIGPWVEGTTSPAGSKMHDFVKHLQSSRGGKGKEYSGKYKPIYHAYGPAHEKLKEHKKNKRL